MIVIMIIKITVTIIIVSNHSFPGRGIRDIEIANKRNKMLLTILVVIQKKEKEDNDDNNNDDENNDNNNDTE